ncbi:uncharacterized protein Fot_44249 [Forsythia ovata]|uniref:C2H2-type domain-containing protein n=1 Tax=Forsythia ovata TaxID=205694 RepID=A0ABD1R2Z9_9LAMI
MSNVPNTLTHTEERVYSCRYCHKKFSNKQAFGGHQNAHKIERFVQRNAQEGRELNFGYTRNSSYCGMTSPTSPGAFNSATQILDRSIINRSYHSEYIQKAMHGGKYLHSMLPIAQYPYAHQPDCGYAGWPKPILTNPQFITPPPRMDNQTISMWNSTFGTTNSNVGTVLGMSEGFTASSFAQPMHNRNDKAESNVQINDRENQEGQDSGLDLSLSL